MMRAAYSELKMGLLKRIIDRCRDDAGLRIALVYALVAGFWILASDFFLGVFFADPAMLTRLATLKGWGFVAVTAAMLYGLVRRDIASMRRTEAHLLQAQKMESLGILAGGIAHDFNNLLTAILGNLSLARVELSPEASALPLLGNIEKAALKASELTRQMLAYAGRGNYVVTPQDLNQLVRETAQLLRVSIPKKIDLEFHLAGDLPVIEADVGQIQQVVMNLVTNASDAIGEALGHIELSTHTQAFDEADIASAFPLQALHPGLYVVLRVSDSGCGMSPETRAHIFDPFFTTKQTGHGLGLSAMLGILRAHGAGIHIDTELGQGSTFQIVFPAHPELASLPKEAKADPPSRFRGRVLLVDDEPAILEATASILKALGFGVVTARDGLEALGKLEAERDGFVLVFMDLTMPRMDGREAFERMRALRADLPVILCSGYTEQDILPNFQGQNPPVFLQKPYLMKELQRTLQAAIPGE